MTEEQEARLKEQCEHETVCSDFRGYVCLDCGKRTNEPFGKNMRIEP